VQPGSDGLDRIRLLLDSPYVSGSMQDIAEEIADKIKSRPTELLINARNPLVQKLRGLPDLKDTKAHAALFGLYHLAQLNSQSRIKPEHARKIDAFLQTQMKGLLQAEQEVVSLGQKLEAWRKCVTEKDAADSQAWGKITTDLVGSTPAEFRQRVTAASNDELGALLLGLYQQMKQL
jgi:hypothetical protein